MIRFQSENGILGLIFLGFRLNNLEMSIKIVESR